MRRRHHYIETVVRLMADARDERVSTMAEAALARAWASDRAAPNRIWDALVGRPKPALRFLLASAPECRHEPRVRLVTAPPNGGRVLRTAQDCPDPDMREAMADVLRASDHPVLLGDFEEALRGEDTMPPQAVVDLALDNPYLCLPAPLGRYHTGLAVVAILKGRLDLLDSYDPANLVSTLVRLAGGTFPAPVAAVCRQWLREMGPGPGRERLCVLAVEGDAEALAAVRDSGQEPGSPSLLPLFLFRFEQWDRYDAVDPDGTLLDEQCAILDDDALIQLREIARRNGREEPTPTPPTAALLTGPDRDVPDSRRSSIEIW
ncbi:hypothetical protein EV382_2763 [Micromonospora violae]|uniref:Uncharacterized protein n=1 Tax=Micromonospora violae TaxID=1278207 RepID=A0A4Q7UIY6_9ACTN|nr:hypothetical protein [Micromonospora violae]RZT79549.1 hypothetical protein EV382_2763 [Micromonospora violae]